MIPTSSEEPLVFAHRGASAELPEHTLAAYRSAIEAGVDGVECDVRLTRDGHLVCFHDRRLDRTSNGTGPLSQFTLDQLRELDYGSWHSSGATATLLTLDDLLDECRKAGRPIRVLVETKHPNRFGGAVEHRLRLALYRHGLLDGDSNVKVTMMSFSPLAVRRGRDLMPRVPTVMLLDRLPPGVRVRRLPFGTRIAGPGLELIRKRPGLVRGLKVAGQQVYVWTVNEPEDVELVVSLGVDGIITDRPKEVLALLGR
ncbi:MAG TPA: glycerophosphodiester phosphodiesterase family protein [Candidatus Limnocylindrales bacterium]